VSQKTVLYVEDNEFNRKIVRQLLGSTTYRLLEATDGEEAVATAIETHPDVILMDVQLPNLSGLDATRRLRGGIRLAEERDVAVVGSGQRGPAALQKAAGRSCRSGMTPPRAETIPRTAFMLPTRYTHTLPSSVSALTWIVDGHAT